MISESAVKPAETKISYRELIWGVLMAALFLMGNLLTVRGLFPVSDSMLLQMTAAAMTGILSCFLGRSLKDSFRLAVLLPWIPVGIMLVWPGVFRIGNGSLDFLNVLIASWNKGHRNELALFASRSAGADLWCFVLFAFLLSGQIISALVQKRSKVLGGIYCLFFFLLQLMMGAFTPFGSSCLITGLLGLCMAEKGEQIVRLKLYGLVFIGFVLSLFAVMAPDSELTAVSSFRKAAGEQLHSLCYGKEVLPQGDLRKADLLSPSQEKMLLVRTNQAKNLYLRGFVGEEYINGSWQELSAAAYGGENTGLMKWLYAHDFDPLTQSAAYYSLLDQKNRPEANQVWVNTIKASRYYTYIPASASEASVGNLKKRRDHRFISRNLTGSGIYTVEEISGSRPSEIMVADDFVSSPETEEQRNYCEAESVYRRFVYEQDTVIDRELYEVVDDLFFRDYEAESDSIYSVVNQVRKVLKENTLYTEEPGKASDDEDPLIWFLTGARRGNAAYYATAAVAAFRAHGIPARYVEGYYLSEEEISDSTDGSVTITGENAHAWAEVYFDGIGWQPVDVTPGYYYDSIALQKMVGIPDTVHKTAALQNDPMTAEQVTDLKEKAAEELTEQVKIISRRVVMIVLGAAAALLLLLTGGFLGAELMRFIIKQRELRKEPYEPDLIFVNRMKNRIYYCLSLWEIPAISGLYRERTDQEICRRIGKIREGEYSRVCELMEKAVYGGMELTTYERRTLKSFVDKVSDAPEKCGWKTKLKFRYVELMQ